MKATFLPMVKVKALYKLFLIERNKYYLLASGYNKQAATQVKKEEVKETL